MTRASGTVAMLCRDEERSKRKWHVNGGDHACVRVVMHAAWCVAESDFV